MSRTDTSSGGRTAPLPGPSLSRTSIPADAAAASPSSPESTPRSSSAPTTGPGTAENSGSRTAPAARRIWSKNIHPGRDSSDPADFTKVNRTLFFAANDGVHDRELWKSNGTRAHTRLVKDIKSGGRGSSPSGLTDVSGTLFFAASGRRYGRELWKSNGTRAGTKLVKDINLT